MGTGSSNNGDPVYHRIEGKNFINFIPLDIAMLHDDSEDCWCSPYLLSETDDEDEEPKILVHRQGN